MDPLAPISRWIVAPLWAAWERTPYLFTYRRMLQTQFDSPEIIRKRQEDRLRVIVQNAYAETSYWRRLFDHLSLKPTDIRTLDDLKRLPVLTKQELRANVKLNPDGTVTTPLLAYPFSEEGTDDALMRLTNAEAGIASTKLHFFKTSGSTGVPLVTVCDEKCAQFKRAAVLRSDEWSGWKRGERIASIWGNPQLRTDWRGRIRRALLERNNAYLDTLKMDECSMNRFTDILLAKPPSLLFGHAHSLYLYAGFLRSSRPEVSIRPRGIISTCMVLHDFERERIRRVFQCEPTDRYGCEEVGLIASQCERHTGLHVNADCLYVELIDGEGNPCEPGTPGRIIITDLVNRAMPILRYEVGDTAGWAMEPCPCGRGLPLLARIEGRVADYVITRTGEYVSGISLTENFACMVPGIAQLQIIQEDIDLFTFNIVRSTEFNDASLRKIAELVGERFGETACFECVFLEKIPQEPSGKYRFCISKVLSQTKESSY